MRISIGRYFTFLLLFVFCASLKNAEKKDFSDTWLVDKGKTKPGSFRPENGLPDQINVSLKGDSIVAERIFAGVSNKESLPLNGQAVEFEYGDGKILKRISVKYQPIEIRI